MKATIKNIVTHTYKPWLEKYLSKKRIYRYGNIKLEIPPEVFHPGFFFSTRILLNYIKQLELKGKTFLEPGCGSGLISIYAAKKDAIVTSADINPVAIEFLKKNAKQNNVELNIYHSDHLINVPKQRFDIIAINPPYYKRKPVTYKDYAWCCGENGEYFSGLFGQIKDYIHEESEVVMVLFENCDLGRVRPESFARQRGTSAFRRSGRR